MAAGRSISLDWNTDYATTLAAWFMGFGAVRVSEGEEKMLDQLRGALGSG